MSRFIAMTSPPNSDSSVNLFDREALAEAQKVLKNRFPQIMQGYITDSEKYILSIEKSIKADNVQGIIAGAHPLKASSDAMGVIRVAKMARILEHMGRMACDGEGLDSAEALKACHALKKIFQETKPLLLALLQNK